MLFPVKQLMLDKEPPLCITKETKVRDALSLMVQNDYSQLPIIDEKGDLVGIITEQIIISMYFHTDGEVSILDLGIDHCQTRAFTIQKDNDIFEALDLLKNIYAIVITDQNKPVGILTAFDTTHFFRDLSEGLILVEDIEITLRQYIETVLPEGNNRDAALQRAFGHDKQNPTRPAKKYDEMSFGDHIQLITTEQNWGKFSPYLEPKEMFEKLMRQVGQIRNQLAHFRGRVEPVQYDALIRARDWLSNRPKPPSLGGENVIKVDVEKSSLRLTDSSGEKYELLEIWLKEHKDLGENRLQFSFDDIENILSSDLPDSAKNHRSWWENDNYSHLQANAWLRAGWLVDNVDFTKGEVIFRETLAAYYPLFFADMLAQLKERRPGVTQVSKAFVQNWISISAGKTGFSFAWVLPREHVLRVELYIDTGENSENKKLFDSLYDQKTSIENKFGKYLKWDRIDNKRACRISISKPFLISSPPTEHESIKKWGVDTMLKFIDVFVPLIKAI